MNMKRRPYFIWDYDLTEEDFQNLLKNGSEREKQWAVTRVLEHAHFSDVFNYLSVNDILIYLPKLKMRSVMRQYWQRALSAWGYQPHV